MTRCRTGGGVAGESPAAVGAEAGRLTLREMGHAAGRRGGQLAFPSPAWGFNSTTGRRAVLLGDLMCSKSSPSRAPGLTALSFPPPLPRTPQRLTPSSECSPDARNLLGSTFDRSLDFESSRPARDLKPTRTLETSIRKLAPLGCVQAVVSSASST